jgi:SM-20-related protein
MRDWPDLFVIEQFFEPVVCGAIVAGMKAADGTAVHVYGQGTASLINEGVRKTLRVNPASETVALITEKLAACKEALEAHFELSLDECEEPQFLRYREGDFFVAHQDGNTGLLRLDSELRRVSIVIFLSRQSEYGGGSLVLTNLRAPADRAKFTVSADLGTLVAFRSETTHEVTPVTHGERLSIVSWYR